MGRPNGVSARAMQHVKAATGSNASFHDLNASVAGDLHFVYAIGCRL